MNSAVNSGLSLTFSIVTPSLNQGKFIEHAIESVLSQEGDFLIDYIVMDGGSDDETLTIISKYELLLQNKQWPVKCKGISYRWFSETDKGQSHAINKGFSIATGDIFAWLNSDDYYASDALNVVAKAAMANPAAGAILGGGEMIDEGGNLVHSSLPPSVVNQESLFKWTNNYFWQPSCFFTRQAWDHCGSLDEDLHYAMDLDLWLNIVKKYPFLTVNSKLSTSLKHPEAKTTAFAYLSVMEAAIVIASHGGGKTVLADLRGYADFLVEKEQAYKQIFESNSWKITAPFRFISSKVRRVFSKRH